jgi:hypothetical protein
MMTNLGFQPGFLDDWLLLTDSRNGSFAILLALVILFVGYALALRDKTPGAEGPSLVEETNRRVFHFHAQHDPPPWAATTRALRGFGRRRTQRST